MMRIDRRPVWLTLERIETFEHAWRTMPFRDDVIAAIEAIPGPRVPKWQAIKEAALNRDLGGREAFITHKWHSPKGGLPIWVTPERREVLETTYRTAPTQREVREALHALPGPAVPRWRAIAALAFRLGISRSPESREQINFTLDTVLYPEPIDLDTAREWAKANRVKVADQAEFEAAVNAARAKFGLGQWIVYRRAA